MLETANLVAYVPTARPADSRRFYQEALGLISMGEDSSAIMFDCNGTMLRLQKVRSVTPASHTVLGWEVGELVTEIRALVGKGVTFLRFQGLEQDRDAIWTAPTGTLVAWFRDPDGNVLSLSQHAEAF